SNSPLVVFFFQLIGPKGVSGLLTIPTALVLSTGIVLFELHISNIAYKDVLVPSWGQYYTKTS
ncbi:hypothetical protein J1N35_016215, partial [Gossypium stocksii]